MRPHINTITIYIHIYAYIHNISVATATYSLARACISESRSSWGTGASPWKTSASNLVSFGKPCFPSFFSKSDVSPIWIRLQYQRSEYEVYAWDRTSDLFFSRSDVWDVQSREKMIKIRVPSYTICRGSGPTPVAGRAADPLCLPRAQQVTLHQRATNSMALLWKLTYKDEASYGSSPPCSSRASESDTTPV